MTRRMPEVLSAHGAFLSEVASPEGTGRRAAVQGASRRFAARRTAPDRSTDHLRAPGLAPVSIRRASRASGVSGYRRMISLKSCIALSARPAPANACAR